MGIFNLFRNKRPTVSPSKFHHFCQKLSKDLSILRKEYFMGTLMMFKREEISFVDSPTVLEKGSRIDSALKGYQLTCVVGLSWNYMKFEDMIPFANMLTEYFDDEDALSVKDYGERYLDRVNQIDLLVSCFSRDIYALLGSPEPYEKAYRLLSGKAVAFRTMSLAATAKLCGDDKTERKLKSELHIK